MIKLIIWNSINDKGCFETAKLIQDAIKQQNEDMMILKRQKKTRCYWKRQKKAGFFWNRPKKT